MKILYGINTIGQGHINRSRTVIDQLIEEGNSVDCVFSGPPPPHYAKTLGNRWLHYNGYEFKINGGRFDIPRTVYKNIRNWLISTPKHLANVTRLVKQENYDLIINDCDPYSSFAGFLLRIPIIALDHQHSIIHPLAERPPGNFVQLFDTFFALTWTVPFFWHSIALDFVENPIKYRKGTLFPLVWKSELDDYEISVENHYCVYLPHLPFKKVVKVFSSVPEENFYIYGLNRSQKKENIKLFPTSRDGFLKCLASCKGVIAHTGFSLSWEVSLFRKPFYSIPLTHHYEQETNAFRLSKYKSAYVANDLTIKDLKKFIQKAEKQNFKTPNRIMVVKPNALTKYIYKVKDTYHSIFR